MKRVCLLYGHIAKGGNNVFKIRNKMIITAFVLNYPIIVQYIPSSYCTVFITKRILNCFAQNTIK